MHRSRLVWFELERLEKISSDDAVVEVDSTNGLRRFERRGETVTSGAAIPKQRRLRRWRDYRTPAGGRPIREFFDTLTDGEAAEVVAAMKEIARGGLEAAKHLRGEIYEVRADSGTRTFRILFAAEGKRSQVLLSVVAFVKKTRKTPKDQLDLAETRLRQWRARGAGPKSRKH